MLRTNVVALVTIGVLASSKSLSSHCFRLQ